MILILIGLIISAAALWILAGFFAWNDSTCKKRFCYHDLVTGRGGMGDGVDCLKCDLSTYDSFNSHLWLFKLLGRVDRKKASEE